MCGPYNACGEYTRRHCQPPTLRAIGSSAGVCMCELHNPLLLRVKSLHPSCLHRVRLRLLFVPITSPPFA